MPIDLSYKALGYKRDIDGELIAPVAQAEGCIVHGVPDGYGCSICLHADSAAAYEIPVVSGRLQGVDCYYCEDGTPHTHRSPSESPVAASEPEKPELKKNAIPKS